MKKYIFFLAFILSFQTGTAIDADKLISAFSKEKDASTVNMGSFITGCMKPFTKELRGIKSMKILNLEDCELSVKQNFNERFKELYDDGYELFVRSNEENEQIHILVKIKKDKIKELVVVSAGDSPSMVRVKGNIDMSHIGNWTNK